MRVRGKCSCAHTQRNNNACPPCQDFLTCAYLMTSKDAFLTRSEMSQLTAYMSDGAEPVRPIQGCGAQGLCLCMRARVLTGYKLGHVGWG